MELTFHQMISRITVIVEKHGKNGIQKKELARRLKIKSKQKALFSQALEKLEQDGILIEKKHKLLSASAMKLISAEVTRVHQTFGFVKTLEDETEYFIPGKYLLGAMPGDKVLIKKIKGRGTSPEGEVVRITECGPGEFTGCLLLEDGKYVVSPDQLIRYPIAVDEMELSGAQVGDKVLAKIIYRGKRHADHRAAVLSTYGDSQTAASCANAALDLAGICKEFPFAVEDRAQYLKKRGIKSRDYEGRTDFRSEIVFTIDGADSKDLDDAVSLEQYDDCYVLGVHIADVSHYVQEKSEIDREAFYRGTSIYYADQVIPMLPKALSNGICSLNPGEDRLTLSAILTLDLEGHLIDFDFRKGVICSRVKGVYEEVNQIFAGTESEEIAKKYAGVRDKLFLMKQLADILTANKRRRGAPDLETRESKIITDENGVAVEIRPRVSGDAERLIEEFMLTANEAAAMAGKMKDVPFVYRVHEPPTEEKLENLNKTLCLLGLQKRNLSPNVKPKALAEILQKVQGSDLSPIVNMQVLRAMSKAKYSENPIGHYGLALENYAHFTSPIRRYPDLMVHRILTALIEGEKSGQIQKRYGKYVIKAAKQSTQTELNAMTLERDCEDCYKAEYMKAHLGEEFDGIISSVASHGIYVELGNTVEGLVRTEDLPGGPYEFDDVMEYRNRITGEKFRIGQKVRVCCVKAEVSSGNVDFTLV
jgi:ribonuclease R